MKHATTKCHVDTKLILEQNELEEIQEFLNSDIVVLEIDERKI